MLIHTDLDPDARPIRAAQEDKPREHANATSGRNILESFSVSRPVDGVTQDGEPNDHLRGLLLRGGGDRIRSSILPPFA